MLHHNAFCNGLQLTSSPTESEISVQPVSVIGEVKLHIG